MSTILDRTAEVIRKAKAIIPLISDEKARNYTASMVEIMESSYNHIVKENLTCPPEMEKRLDEVFSVIEALYNQYAAN
jgi:hypothetical protein